MRKETRLSTVTTFIQHSFGSSSYSKQRRKINKKNSNCEKKKKTLFPDDRLLCIVNPKDAARKLGEFINDFDKVAECKINTQKSYTLTIKDQKKKLRKLFHIPFH